LVWIWWIGFFPRCDTWAASAAFSKEYPRITFDIGWGASTRPVQGPKLFQPTRPMLRPEKSRRLQHSEGFQTSAFCVLAFKFHTLEALARGLLQNSKTSLLAFNAVAHTPPPSGILAFQACHLLEASIMLG
jgi:hypothetical protein